MLESLRQYWTSGAYMPHGMCYLWEPPLLWLHVVSDGLIALAYYAIPPTLAYLVVRARREVPREIAEDRPGGVPYEWMWLAFALFIVACGTTHLIGVWTVWTPAYWISGGVKAVTAVVSLATAVALPPLVPRALSLVREARVSAGRQMRLERANEELADAQRIAGLGRWEWDPAAGTVTWSEELAAMYGIPPSEAPTTIDGLLATVHPDDRGAVRGALEGAAREQGAFSFEHRALVADGERWMHARGRADGRVRGTAQDVTERRRTVEREVELARAQAAAAAAEARADEMSRLAAALERSNRELEQFAYAASHDLRAPMRGIANLAEWLEEDLDAVLGGESRQHLALLKGRVGRMEALIDGLLQFSRAGRNDPRAGAVDVAELLSSTVDLLAPPPGARVSVGEGMPVLHTERAPLQQVFLNLLGNALKHAERPDPTVRVECRRSGAFWEFSVSDDGPGIAPEYHERVFGIFQTLQSRDRVEGTGIGLALVKKIVEHRGGTVHVESAPGHGATFRFLWPAGPPPEDTP